MHRSLAEPPLSSGPAALTRAGVGTGDTLALILCLGISEMKKILLVVGGAGALMAIVGGFGGVEILIVLGAPAMLISLLLLPWVKEDA